MPAPSPELVAINPPPLNPTAFPYAVDEFDAPWLANFGGLIPLSDNGNVAVVPAPANPHRYEPV